MHLQNMVSIFYKDYLEKPIIISVSLDFAPFMAKPIVKLPTKQKQGRLPKITTKHVKK